jgi:hypothetical protein
MIPVISFKVELIENRKPLFIITISHALSFVLIFYQNSTLYLLGTCVLTVLFIHLKINIRNY